MGPTLEDFLRRLKCCLERLLEKELTPMERYEIEELLSEIDDRLNQQ